MSFMMNESPRIPTARRRIAKIRCLQDCLTSLKDKKPFPKCLCYVPSEIEYLSPGKTPWKLHEYPRKKAPILAEIPTTSNSRLIASGEEVINNDGKWLKVIKV